MIIISFLNDDCNNKANQVSGGIKFRYKYSQKWDLRNSSIGNKLVQLFKPLARYRMLILYFKKIYIKFILIYSLFIQIIFSHLFLFCQISFKFAILKNSWIV